MKVGPGGKKGKLVFSLDYVKLMYIVRTITNDPQGDRTAFCR